jgi:hypothetical protein
MLHTMSSERTGSQSKNAKATFDHVHVAGQKKTTRLHLKTISAEDEYRDRFTCIGTLPIMQQEIPAQKLVDSYPHLEGVTLHELPRDRRHMDILVGADLAIGLVYKESRPGSLTAPSAEKTGFG